MCAGPHPIRALLSFIPAALRIQEDQASNRDRQHWRSCGIHHTGGALKIHLLRAVGKPGDYFEDAGFFGFKSCHSFSVN